MSETQHGNEGKLQMNESKQILSETVKSLIEGGVSVELSAFGHSMIPLLSPGQKVKLTPIDISLIVKGDLVAFQKHDYLVIHRVHDILQSNETLQLITKGDSNLNPDEPVGKDTYLAKVSMIYRGKNWRELSPTSIHSASVLFLGKFYSLPFWLWKHLTAKLRGKSLT
jgi:signal peptidase I